MDPLLTFGESQSAAVAEALGSNVRVDDEKGEPVGERGREEDFNQPAARPAKR